MDQTEYRRLRKEVKLRYNKAIQRAEKERVEALMAIDKVRNMMRLPEEE